MRPRTIYDDIKESKAKETESEKNMATVYSHMIIAEELQRIIDKGKDATDDKGLERHYRTEACKLLALLLDEYEKKRK